MQLSSRVCQTACSYPGWQSTAPWTGRCRGRVPCSPFARWGVTGLNWLPAGRLVLWGQSPGVGAGPRGCWEVRAPCRGDTGHAAPALTVTRDGFL